MAETETESAGKYIILQKKEQEDFLADSIDR